MRTSICRFVCLTLLLGSVAVGCYVATMPCSHAMPPGMEPERISHYDPEAVPKGVPNDLSPITDPNGMRDTFFYPDGIGKGRVVHMRFPKNFVLSNLGGILPRHSDHLGFLVIYPELVSVASPGIWKEMHKRGGHVPDSELAVGITRPLPNYLTGQAASFLSEVDEMKKRYPGVQFETLSAPDGFTTSSCDHCRVKGLRRIITYPADAGLNFPNNQSILDTYIEWDAQGSVTRLMQCMHTDRPNCLIEIRSCENNKFYNLSIDFHDKLLPRLSDVIERVSRFVNSSVIKFN